VTALVERRDRASAGLRPERPELDGFGTRDVRLKAATPWYHDTGFGFWFFAASP
jgi:hypothetical protein